MKISIQCNELGQRGGIGTYSNRLNDALNKIKGVESKQFVSRIRNGPDLISVQYEPGLMPPQNLQKLIQKYPQPIVITSHHMGVLPQFYPLVDGIVIHDKSQLIGLDEPWSYKVIPHPAIVFPRKDKKKLREKYNIPQDKKVVGTMGFIAGTGKKLPDIVRYLLKELEKDEFLYFATSFWKGGDFGFSDIIRSEVKKLGKEDQFRLDTDFLSEEELNEKMQLCDLLFAWNKLDRPGSNSGIAMDMMGSRTKLIVRDSPHYSYPASLKGVEAGSRDMDKFARDVFNVLRNKDLSKTPNPDKYSWDNKVKEYLEYFNEILGF